MNMARSRSFARLRMTSVALGMTSAVLGLAGCKKASPPDAYGNFEAEEVTVSSQATGELRLFIPVEGTHVERDAIVGMVDTVQLSLELAQLIAQRQSTSARVAAAAEQIAVLEAQVGIAKRAYDRTLRLAEEKAATAQ